MNTKITASSSSVFLFEWLDSERDFASAYLRNHYPQLSEEDIEDIFGDVCLKQANAGEKAITLFERGVLVQRLNWAALSFIARRNATVRGGGMDHVDLSEIEEHTLTDDRDPLAKIFQQGEISMVKTAIRDLCPTLNRKERILSEVIGEVLGAELGFQHWSEAFSEEQQQAFMSSSRGGITLSGTAFRREVNRTLRTLIAKLSAKIRRNSVHFAN